MDLLTLAYEVFKASWLILVILFIIPFVLTSFSAPFVPVSKKVAQKMIKAANLKKNEKHVDIGSGNGKVLFVAAPFCLETLGYEIQWPLVFWTKIKAFILRKKNVKVECKNMYKADLSDTDVITMYLIPRILKKVEQKLEQSNLKEGTRIISYAFKFPTWKPEKVLERDGFMGPIFVYEVGQTTRRPDDQGRIAY